MSFGSNTILQKSGFAIGIQQRQALDLRSAIPYLSPPSMIRALHLIDSSADSQSQTAAMQLQTQLGQGFEMQARAIHSWGGVASNVLKLRREKLPFDLIHAFGPRSLAVAVMSGKRILYSPAEFPSRKSIGWIRAAMPYRDLHIVCPTDTMRRAFVERGVAIERCHLIRPSVAFSKINRRRDDVLRASLGFSEEDHVILLAGESTRAAAHHLGTWAVSILHVLDPQHKLLLWGRGDLADAQQTFGNKLGQPDLLALAEQRLGRKLDYEALLPAADTILITATAPVATLPIAISMAAALPIVSVVSATVSELLEDRHTALFVTKPIPRLIAQRILDLRADPQLQWAIADQARTEAYEYFSQTRMLEQFRALYSQVAANKPIEIPQPVPGPGLRFQGAR